MFKLSRSLISSLFIIVLLVNPGFTQDKETSIQGYIYDKSTGEPIENVNVYITNTTWGSSTNKEGYYRIHHLPQGVHELVVSCIGYEYVTNKINLKDGNKLNLNFNLNPVIYEIEPTRVEGSIPTEWLEDLEFFKIYFLGQTDFAEDCIIENSEVLNFAKSDDSIFKASAMKPLVITNRALGYKIDCILISFNFNKSSSTNSWSVKPKFTELKPEDDEELTEWIENRIEAYLGSRYHFLRSFISKRLPEEGFDIYKVAKPGQRVRGAVWRPGLVDYDDHIETEVHSKDIILRLGNIMYVVYSNSIESWIGLNYTNITLDKFAYPYEENAYRVYGEWAKHGIANLLPKNFKSKD
jgi:hypothetical protein